MISFRYHLVTIVAVFLALGLGLLAGTTVIKPLLVNQLQDRTDSLLEQSQDLRRQVADLRDQNDALVPALTTGRLPGAEVVIVTYEGTDSAMISQAQGSLQTAGADVVAVLPVTSRIATTDGEAHRSLAELAGVPSSESPISLQRDIAIELARRLDGGGEGIPAEADLLAQLVSEGFIRKGDLSDATLRRVGGPGQVVVVLAGGQVSSELRPQAFMVPLVEQLAGQMTVVAGEPTDTADPFVSLLRADDQIPSEEIATVDDLDQSIGGVALVLGIDRMLRFPGNGGGHYGDEGTSLIPPLPTDSP